MNWYRKAQEEDLLEDAYNDFWNRPEQKIERALKSLYGDELDKIGLADAGTRMDQITLTLSTIPWETIGLDTHQMTMAVILLSCGTDSSLLRDSKLLDTMAGFISEIECSCDGMKYAVGLYKELGGNVTPYGLAQQVYTDAKRGLLK